MSSKQIKHILVALDVPGPSRDLLDKAISIAKTSDAKVTGIHVLVVQPTLIASVINYRKYLTKKAEQMLDSAKKYCENQDVKFTSKITQGKPADKINEFAKKGKVDLVITGSRGFGGIKSAILGSVANSIVHKSKVSVLVVK